jgi:hypothetical protein
VGFSFCEMLLIVTRLKTKCTDYLAPRHCGNPLILLREFVALRARRKMVIVTSFAAVALVPEYNFACVASICAANVTFFLETPLFLPMSHKDKTPGYHQCFKKKEKEHSLGYMPIASQYATL